jgi:hypothetical protein
LLICSSKAMVKARASLFAPSAGESTSMAM